MENDDVWGDDTDDRLELDREWQSRRDEHTNSGYREGVEQGKHTTAQKGFNIGFREGVAGGRTFGRARGVISALHQFANQFPEIEAELAEIEAIGERLGDTDQEAALKSFATVKLKQSAESDAASDPQLSDEMFSEDTAQVNTILDKLSISLDMQPEDKSESQAPRPIAYEHHE
mmetsp:Transcript_34325/g.41475  ORF Transcript_34325/g.41475 Transcript_34325/m.41475 type:complete len:174 (+) Transcript_34325:179-700(+)